MARGVRLWNSKFLTPNTMGIKELEGIFTKGDIRSFDAMENIAAGEYSKTDLNSLISSIRRWNKMGIGWPVSRVDTYGIHLLKKTIAPLYRLKGWKND